MSAVLNQVNESASRTYVRVEYPSTASHRVVILADNSSSSAYSLDINQDIRLSQRDFELFLAMLDSEEGPNDALRQAAEDYNRKYS